MTLLHLVFFIGVCAAFVGIAVVMLGDVFGELDRVRDEEIAAAHRHTKQA